MRPKKSQISMDITALKEDIKLIAELYIDADLSRDEIEAIMGIMRDIKTIETLDENADKRLGKQRNEDSKKSSKYDMKPENEKVDNRLRRQTSMIERNETRVKDSKCDMKLKIKRDLQKRRVAKDIKYSRISKWDDENPKRTIN